MFIRGKNNRGKLTYDLYRTVDDVYRDWNLMAKANRQAKECSKCLYCKDGFCGRCKRWCNIARPDCEILKIKYSHANSKKQYLQQSIN